MVRSCYRRNLCRFAIKWHAIGTCDADIRFACSRRAICVVGTALPTTTAWAALSSPPQSVSVSVPFFIPWYMRCRHWSRIAGLYNLEPAHRHGRRRIHRRWRRRSRCLFHHYFGRHRCRKCTRHSSSVVTNSQCLDCTGGIGAGGTVSSKGSPQSMSVSSRFWIPSWQSAGTQR